MRVKLLADSCFVFEHSGVRILTDPWLGTRIYGGSWVQFPQPVLSGGNPLDVEWVYISHIHQDHCDLKTISQIPRSARILTLDRSPNFVARSLEYWGLGHEIINVPLGQRFKLADGLEVEILDANPEHAYNNMLDSSLLLHTNDYSILFANDNLPYPGQIEYLQTLDLKLAILPPSGGSGYPACYENLTDHQKLIRRDEIAKSYFESASSCLRMIDPEFFLWSAHSHMIAGRNAWLNRFMSWPQSGSEPYEFLAKSQNPPTALPLLLRSGDWVDLSEVNGPSTLEEAAQFYNDEEDRLVFIAAEEQHGRPYDFEHLDKPGPGCNIHKLLRLAFSSLVERITTARLDLPWKLTVVWETSSASMELFTPFRYVEGSAFNETGRERSLEIRLDSRLLVLLITGLFSWNIADASGFLRYRRNPDEYTNELYLALNYLKI